MIDFIKKSKKYLHQKRYDFKTNKRERFRLSILLIGTVFFVDYLFFCFQTDHNVFGIFPELPILQEQIKRVIYLPGLQKDEIIRENRNVPICSDNKELVRYLIKSVARGSHIRNTRIMVPYTVFVRHIWFEGNSTNSVNEIKNHCIIDIETSILNNKDRIIPGSEVLFRRAVEKTILTNIPSVKKVTIVASGNPNNYLWEFPN